MENRPSVSRWQGNYQVIIPATTTTYHGFFAFFAQTLILLSIFFLRGERSSVGRAPGCGSGGRGFETHRSPHF